MSKLSKQENQNKSKVDHQPNADLVDNQDSVVIFRGSTAKDLLKFAGSWAGNDIEECLQAVYDNRSKAEFD